MNLSPEILIVLMSLAFVALTTGLIWLVGKVAQPSKIPNDFKPKTRYFCEEFYRSKIRGQGFQSSVELSNRSDSYAVRIYAGDIETEVSWPSNTTIEIHTNYPKHHSLPFNIAQDSTPNPKPTGDHDFDQLFCVWEDSAQPSAPIREILKQCSGLDGHQKVSLQPNGIVSTIRNSIDVPFKQVMDLHYSFFKAYAQNPEVLDIQAEHQSVAQASIR